MLDRVFYQVQEQRRTDRLGQAACIGEEPSYPMHMHC